MPIYEYTCTKCPHDFELLIRSEKDIPTCPKCGNKKLEKLMSAPAAHCSSDNDCPNAEYCGTPKGCGGCPM